MVVDAYAAKDAAGNELGEQGIEIARIADAELIEEWLVEGELEARVFAQLGSEIVGTIARCLSSLA